MQSPLKVLDLFSGIGGFSLGLESTGGFKTAAFCEIEPYCQAVLKQHWPDVPIYDDVRTLTAERLRADGIEVDAICGGFPCQDISLAGRGAGLTGERSGLWFEFYRLIEEVRPQVAIIENVPALRSRGLAEVLRCLSQIGYDAEWHCIPASAVGAPHRRDRLWIVAHAPCEAGRRRLCEANAVYNGAEFGNSRTVVANASTPGLSAPEQEELRGTRWREERGAIAECDWWPSEPNVGRMAHGVPARVDRLKALGNAVVPAIPALIGRAILQARLDAIAA